MQTTAPEYTKSKYFVAEPDWHLKPEASDELKAEFEKEVNSKGMRETLEEDYPDMKHPWYTWEGKIIDKG